MRKETTVVIVGAGPAGLYFASLCEKEKIDYLLIKIQKNGKLIAIHVYF